LNPARSLTVASLAESATLAVLVLVAVPLKHLVGADGVVRIMGPLHGMTFLVYLWTLMGTAGAGGWRAVEVIRMILVACVPLAGFINQAWLARKLRASPGATAEQ
jgi:integral membrane protein